MSILQSIDYKAVTQAELEQQKEKMIAERLKTLLPQADIKINLDDKKLRILEKLIPSFQVLAEKTKGVFQTEIDEQHLTVSVISSCFTLEPYDLHTAFQDVFSKDTLEIFPTTDEQGNPCVSISKFLML